MWLMNLIIIIIITIIIIIIVFILNVKFMYSAIDTQ